MENVYRGCGTRFLCKSEVWNIDDEGYWQENYKGIDNWELWETWES